MPPSYHHLLYKLQTLSRIDPWQLGQLPASDANSQNVFSKYVRAKLAFLKNIFQ
jgi:hypothetical protein